MGIDKLITRSRRLRKNASIRSMVSETSLKTSDLIYPLFVCEGEGIKVESSVMPEVYTMSVDNIVKECIELKGLGILSIILFGIPKHKDNVGSEGYNDDSIVCRAIKAIKTNVKDIIVITDVCLCEYTDHGHCGVVLNGDVDNDSTVKLLCEEALSHAKAGADIVAPSDMMDGRVGEIRKILDKNGYENTLILSYSAKYASAYYGPFRDVAKSAPSFGDRKTYQMDYANRLEAIKEIQQDIAEGADMVMVKPALAYLDIVRDAKESIHIPLVVYNVSGEYVMIINAINNGIVSKSIILETLLSMKRAGANLIITYFAKYIAKTLHEVN